MKKWMRLIASFLMVIFFTQFALEKSMFNYNDISASVRDTLPEPTNLHVLNVEEEAVSIQWDEPQEDAGITGYEIYQNGSYVQTVNNNYCRVGHLVPNTSYSFSVKAVNEEGNKSNLSNTIQVVTEGRQYENISNDLQQVNSDDLNVNDEIKDSADGYSNGENDYIVPNVTYLSEEVVDTEAPTPPTDLKIISKTDTTISISWTASSDNVGLKSYEIYSNDVLLEETSGTVYLLKGLLPEQTYNLKIKAKDVAGNISSESNTLVVITDASGSLLDKEAPTAPSNLAIVSKNETTAELSWNTSTDNDEVQEYYIYSGEVVVGKSDTNSYTVTKLDPNTTYFLTVKAVDKTGNISESSNEISVTTEIDVTAPSMPQNFKVDSKTASSVTLAWDKSEDNVAIEGYDVYIEDEKVGFTSNNSITITGLVPNTVNKYRILARDTSGNLSDFTESVEFTTDVDIEIPSKPANLQIFYMTGRGFQLSWELSYDNVAVTGYEIYVGDEKVGETTDNYYNISGLNPNTAYSIYVKAIDGAGNVSEASDARVVTTYVDDYGNSINEAFEIQENINVAGRLDYGSDWDYFYFVTGGAGKYIIESTSNFDVYGYLYDENGNVIASDDDSGEDNDFKINHILQENTKYYVAIRPFSSGTGDYSLMVTGNLEKPLAPVLERIEQTDNSITLAWTDNNEKIDYYEIYRDDVLYSTINSYEKSFVDNNLVSQAEYSYKVVAVNILDTSSDYSNVINVTIDKDEEAPEAPQNLNLSSSSINSIKISWDIPNDNGVLINYEIYCDNELIGESTTNSFIYSNSIEFFNLVHSYKVRVKDSGENYSEFSEINEFSNSYINVALNETVVSSITYPGQYVYFKFVPNKNTTYILKSIGSIDVYGYLYDNQGNMLSYNDDGSVDRNFLIQYLLEKDKTYYIGVRHYNSLSTGDFGINITKVDDEDPTAPSNLQITESSDYSVALSWEAATDDVAITNYLLYRNDEVYQTLSSNTLSFTDIDILPGTKNKYYVVARDAVGNLSERSEEIEFIANSDNESPTKVINIVNTSVASNVMKLSWDASTDNYKVKCYYVYLNDELKDTVTTNSCTIANLSSLTKYSVKIIVSDYSDNLSEATIIEEQTDDYASYTSGAAAINIGSITEGKIDYSNDSDYFKFTTKSAGQYSIVLDNKANVLFNGIYQLSNDAYKGYFNLDNGYKFNLEANTEYYFRLYKNGISSKVNYSITVNDLIVPTIPANVNITNQGKDGITLIWDASSDDFGIKEYHIYKNDVEIGVVNGSITTFTDTDVVEDEIYSYNIVAVDICGNKSGKSVAFKAKAGIDNENPEAPDNLYVSAKTGYTVTLNWTAAIDNVMTVYYEIYNGDTLVGTTRDLSYLVSGLSTKTIYDFKVKAVDSSLLKSELITVSVETFEDDVADDFEGAIELVYMTNQTGNINFANDVDCYKFNTTNSGTYILYLSYGRNYISIYDENGNKISGSNYDSYNVKYQLKENKTYYVKVSYSSARSYTLKLQDNEKPTKVAIEETSRGDSSITISWNEATDNVGVANYYIYKNGTIITSVSKNTLTYTFTNLESESENIFYVAVVDALGNISENSNELTLTTDKDEEPPTVPGSFNVKRNGIKQIYLNWTASTDNGVFKNYEVFVDGVRVGTTTNRYYYYSMPSIEDNHTFKVRAKDSGNNYSDFTEELSKGSDINTHEFGVMSEFTIDVASEYYIYKFIAPQSATYEFDLSGNRYINIYLYNASGSSLVSGGTGNQNTVTIKKELVEGEIYYLLVNSSYAEITCTLNSRLIDEIAPTAPENLLVSNKTVSSITLTWDAATDNILLKSYDVYKDGEYLATVTDGVSYTINNLLSEEEHTYTVYALDANNNKSDSSNSLTVKMDKDEKAPTAPVINSNTITSTTVYVYWNIPTDDGVITGYEVYLGDECIERITNRNYTFINLDFNTKYKFKVKAIDSGNNKSDFSNELTLTTKEDDYYNEKDKAESINYLEKKEGTINYNGDYDYFKFVPTETKAYRISVDTNYVGNNLYLHLYNNDGNTITYDRYNKTFTYNLEAGKTYYLSVNFSSIINYSLLVGESVAPSKIENLSLVSKNGDTATINWNPSIDESGIKYYEIYRNNTKLTTVDGNITSFTDSGLLPISTYYYKIVAVDNCFNKSANSEVIGVTTERDVIAPSVPENLSCMSKTGYIINLFWSASTDNEEIASYDIFCDGEYIETVNTTSYTFNNLIANTEYKFQVLARDRVGNISEKCEEVKVSTYEDDFGDTTLTAYELTYLTTVNGTINYNYDKDYFKFTTTEKGAYKLRYSGVNFTVYDSNNKTVSGNIKNGIYSANLEANKTYYVYFTNYYLNNYSITLEDNEKPSAPTNIVRTEVRDNGLAISWTSSTDNVAVTSYEIYKDGVYLDSVNGNITSYIINSLVPNTNYLFKVRAIDASLNYSDFSEEVTIKTLEDTTAPSKSTNLRVSTKDSTSITILWNAGSDNIGVVGYNIYRNGIKIGTVTDRRFTDSNVIAGTYSYTVRTIDAAGNEAEDSNSVLYDNEAPVATNINLISNTVTSITISWEPFTDNVGVTKYEVYRDNALLRNIYTTSFTDSNLDANTEYEYYVKGYDASGNNIESAKLKVFTVIDNEAPTKPIGLNVYNMTSKSVTLTWQAAADNYKVAGYEVYRDGVSVGKTTTNKFKDTNLTTEALYSYTVKAYDVAGNYSEISDSWRIVPLAPRISSVIPTTGLTIGGAGNTTLKMTFINSSNAIGSRATFEISLDEGKTWSEITSTPSLRYNSTEGYYTCNLDLSSYNTGSCKIRYTFYDEDGASASYVAIYAIDRTAPITPSSFNATSDAGKVILTWTPSPEGDVNSYKIYRSNSIDGEYSLIGTVTDLNNLVYRDLNVTIGQTYYYKIIASDKFNQNSNYSEAIAGVPLNDDIKPTIIGIEPLSGITFGKSASITVRAEDNLKLKSITLQYSIDDGKTWINIETRNTISSATFMWNTSLVSGDVKVRAIAMDENGNESESDLVRTFKVDTTAPSRVENITASGYITTVVLKWSDVPEEDFSYFLLEYKDSENGEYVTLDRIYTTLGKQVNNLSPNKTYWFRVFAVDIYGNKGEASNVVQVTTAADNINPTLSTISPNPGYYSSKIDLSVKTYDNVGVKSIVFQGSYDKNTWTDLNTVAFTSYYTTAYGYYTLDVSTLRESRYYIRALVTDFAGNTNVSQLSNTYVEYMIDHTAPVAPINVTTENSTGSITITWDKNTETDLKYYNVYRATSLDGEYSLVASNLTSLGYIDRNISSEITYYYKVTAKDAAGNEGVKSLSVSGQLTIDTEAPKIISISPTEGSSLGKNPRIGVLAFDNFRLARIYLEYKNTSGAWIKIGEIESSNYSETGIFTWDNSLLSDGEYELRAYTEDEAGNVSAYSYTKYIINIEAPEKPQLNLLAEGFKVSLSWNISTASDLAGYRIYRSNSLNGSYKKIAEIMGSSYVDELLTPGNVYYYKVEAIDIYTNSVFSNEVMGIPLSIDTYAPTCDAGLDNSTTIGVEVAFDGSYSKDNVGIEQYLWNFGDGSTSNIAQPTHVYLQTGTYTVTLTVKDAAGNSATDTMTVIVYPEYQVGKINIIVKDANTGALISNADVYIDFPDNTPKQYVTNSRGLTSVIATVGNYEISAYKTGYLPNAVNGAAVQYQENTVTIYLSKGELVVGDLTVKRMELDEIVAAGIDINAPENQFVYNFTVNLTFQETPLPVQILYVNGNGEIVKGSPILKVFGGKGSTGNGGKGSGGNVTTIIIPNKEHPEIAPNIVYLLVPESVSWLKEFFEVQLVVQNMADKQFVIEDSTTSLILPEGISLAKTRETQSLTKDLGDIAGGETKVVSWVIRGDKEGSYNLSAEFNGTLMPFEAPVNTTFKTEESFRVYAGDGMRIYVTAEDCAYIKESYYVNFLLVNESDRPIYNISTSFGSYIQGVPKSEVIIKYPDGTEEKQIETGAVTYDVDSDTSVYLPVLSDGDTINVKTLMPGSYILGTYVTFVRSDEDPDEVYLKLIDAFTQSAGGNANIPVSISTMSSHMSKYILKVVDESTYVQDPIDTNTGAFVVNTEAISVTGESLLGFEMEYSSTRENDISNIKEVMANIKENVANISNVTSTLSNYLFGLDQIGNYSLGKGWSHNYETSLQRNADGTITVYWTPYSYTIFTNKNSSYITVYGEKDENGHIVLSKNAPITNQTYYSTNENMKGYSLYCREDGIYKLTFANGNIYYFNSNGQLIKMVDSNGKFIKLAYGESTLTVTEPLSGQKLVIKYNSNGLIESVSDGNGRKTLYEYDSNNCLVKITYPNGTTNIYTYDSMGHIIKGYDGEGICYVTNSYDDKGRVIAQDDGVEGNKITTLTYDSESEYWRTITTVTDREGNVRKLWHNRLGQLVKIQDELGNIITYTYDEKGNKTSETDPLGNTVLYNYDSYGNIIKTTDALGVVTTMTYDSDGNLKTVTSNGVTTKYFYTNKNLLRYTIDSLGNRTTYTYDSNGCLLATAIKGVGTTTNTYNKGQLVTASDYKGSNTTMTYNKYGWVSTITDRVGNTTTYKYDLIGNKVSEQSANGLEIKYTYYKNGKLKTIIDEKGNTVAYRYDGNGNLIQETDAYGKVISYEYDGESRLTKVTDVYGNATEFVYDAAGRVIEERSPSGVVKRYTYDANGNLLTLTETDKGTTIYEYYNNGSVKSVTDSKGSKTSYFYDKRGYLIRVEDAAGKATTYTYDANGNRTSERDPLGNTTYYTYDSRGNILTIKDPNGNVTIYTYDVNGNLLTLTDAAGAVTSYEYDKEDRVIKITNPKGYSQEYVYDNMDKVIEVIDELGNKVKVEYDKSGNVICEKDANGIIITQNVYDKYNNLLTSTDALGNVSEYKYDSYGKIIESVNALNNKTAYYYNLLGDINKVSDPLEGLTEQVYNKDGSISSIIDAMGNKTIYKYDELGRLIEETTPIGSTKTYGYNSQNLVDAYINGRGQKTNYTYDAAGRIKSFRDNLGTVSFTYDANGNVLTVTDKNGTITREYDSLNRVTKYTDFRGYTIEYAYDTCGNLIALTYPGGKIVRYAYNACNQLVQVTDWEGRITTYEYDKNGRLIKTNRPNGSSLEITYDAAGQITQSKDVDADGIVISQYDYQYDVEGNVTVEQSSWVNGSYVENNAVMTYGEGNKLLTYNGKTVKYDADGNMTYGPLNGEMVVYKYDCRNRLVKVGNTEYVYDAENNRIAVIENGVRTDYVINTNASLSQVLMKVDSNGSITYYVYGDGLIGEDTNGEYLTYHFDRRGSTVAITDMESYVTDRFEYAAYGELIAHYGDTKTPFMYNGRYGVMTDSNGLYYMRARYYNPEIKRFINQDVVLGNITDSRTLNRYAYVYGNPIDSTDPFGLSPEISGGSIGHTILDVLGMIPGVGEVFDAVNAGWYLAEGDYANAALCAVSLVPIAGDFIGKGVKWGSKAFKATKVGAKACDVAGIVKTGIKTGVKTTGNIVSTAFKNTVKTSKNVLRCDAIPGAGVVSDFIGNVAKETKKVLRKSTDEFVTLYHGTGDFGAASIRNNGVSLSAATRNMDFGRGFYTTTNLEQAQKWASRKFNGAGEVLTFKVPTSEFEKLKGLSFNSGDSSWLKFVTDSRNGAISSYDVISGPMLLNPKEYLKGKAKAVSGGQQTYFGTQKAVDMINKYLIN